MASNMLRAKAWRITYIHVAVWHKPNSNSVAVSIKMSQQSSLARSLSQVSVTSQVIVAEEPFAEPISQQAVAEENFAEPIGNVDSQSTAVSVVSFDCTSAGARQDQSNKLKRENQRLKRRNDILVSKLRLHEESAIVQRNAEKKAFSWICDCIGKERWKWICAFSSLLVYTSGRQIYDTTDSNQMGALPGHKCYSCHGELSHSRGTAVQNGEGLSCRVVLLCFSLLCLICKSNN